MEVHRHLGHGFLEAVYREAPYWELATRAIPYRAEVAFPITFKGHVLATSYRADVVCCGEVVVELKALSSIGGTEAAQVLNYLKAIRVVSARPSVRVIINLRHLPNLRTICGSTLKDTACH